ncbi:unnamed protein product, partial [marine sediment metagenome]
MGDLFHEDVPFTYIDTVFKVMSGANWHTFQVLTKRPERMLKWTRQTLVLNEHGYLPNVWLGITTEDQHTYNERIEIFHKIG